MALMYVFLVIFLMFYLNEKGKAYREQKRRNRIAHERYLRNLSKHKPQSEEQIKQMLKNKQEAAYRKELEDQGYSDDLITTILPIINDKE